MLARQVQHSLALSALFALSSQDYVTNLIFPLRYLIPHPTVYCTFISRGFFYRKLLFQRRLSYASLSPIKIYDIGF